MRKPPGKTPGGFFKGTKIMGGQHGIGGTYTEQPVTPHWLTPPIDYEDEPKQWANPERSHDGFTDTVATQDIPTESPSTWLELRLASPVNCSKIRYFITRDSELVEEIRIEVFYEGAWHDTGEYSFHAGEYWSVNIPAGIKSVSKARMRFINVDTENSQTVRLHEFDFWQTN
jgi:hypothetical protein